jgi:chromate transporter
MAVTPVGRHDSTRRVGTPPHTLAQLFLGFLSIGARSFGGVLPAAHHVMVEQRHWLTPEEFTETIGLCQVLPGPNIANAAILLGKRWLGLRGAIVAFLGLFALPYLWVLALALLYTRWAARPLVSAVVTGVGASGAGLVMATAVKLGRPIARKPAAVVLMAGCFVAVAIARVSLLVVMPIAVIVGLYCSRRRML